MPNPTSGGTGIRQTVHQALELPAAQRSRCEAEIRRDWATLGDIMDDLQDQNVMRQAWS